MRTAAPSIKYAKNCFSFVVCYIARDSDRAHGYFEVEEHHGCILSWPDIASNPRRGIRSIQWSAKKETPSRIVREAQA